MRRPLRQSRNALLDATDIAREVGADFRASRAEDGKVSSFYLTPSAAPGSAASPPKVSFSGYALLDGAPPDTACPEIIVPGTESCADLRLRIYIVLKERF